MLRRSSVLAVLFVLSVLASACAPQAAPVATAASAATAIPVTGPTVSSAATKVSSVVSTQVATMMPPSGPAHVALAPNSQFGSILVDDKGMSLYLFTKDSPNTPTCYGKCASFWPALTTSGAPVAGPGLDASKLGTTTRTDGSTQVTYNGWPVYYYAKDNQPGDVNGERVGGSWFLVSPSGDPIK